MLTKLSSARTLTTAICVGGHDPTLELLGCASPDLEILAYIESPKHALLAARTERPRIMLVDYATLDALTGVNRLLRHMGEVAPVVFFCDKLAPGFVQTGIDGHVAGMLLRREADELPRMIEIVAESRACYSPAICEYLAQNTLKEALEPIATVSVALTDREVDTLRWLAAGLSVKQIAASLGLRPKTIDTYRTALMRKLDIHDRVRLTRFAIRQGLLSAPD